MKRVSEHPWHLVFGPVIWAGWFVTIYGGLGVACRISPPSADEGVVNWINISLGIFTLIAALYLAYCAVLSWRLARRATQHQPSFVLHVAAAVYLFSTLATLAIGIPLIGLEPCI